MNVVYSHKIDTIAEVSTVDLQPDEVSLELVVQLLSNQSITVMQLNRQLADLRHSFQTVSNLVTSADNLRRLQQPAFITGNITQFGSVVSSHEDSDHLNNSLTSSRNAYAESFHLPARRKVTKLDAANQRSERQPAVTSSLCS